MTVQELIKLEEKELTDLTIRHNKIVEYQNENPSFYHFLLLSELMDKLTEKEDFILTLKSKLK